MDNNLNNSREFILSSIRNGKPQHVALPDVPLYSYSGDLVEGFRTHLTEFDGKFQEFSNRSEAIEWLQSHLDSGKNIFSNIADFRGTVSSDSFNDPHLAHIVDICVAEGVLGVAETGSVWVNDEVLGVSAAALFSTDLYLLLDRSNLVDGLHAAYKLLNIKQHQYGAFYTGPSATADIEAVHITGAQGEISLTVLLY
ncbi:MAG: LutC/YkgG family protein [Bacteroidales bacterium]